MACKFMADMGLKIFLEVVTGILWLPQDCAIRRFTQRRRGGRRDRRENFLGGRWSWFREVGGEDGRGGQGCLADGFAGAAFGEYVIGDDDGGAAVVAGAPSGSGHPEGSRRGAEEDAEIAEKTSMQNGLRRGAEAARGLSFRWSRRRQGR